MTDEDLRALESAISRNPSAAPTIAGTGGLRKIRLAPKASSSGKSGGMRICYAYFGDFGLIYLCAVFSKSDQANLSNAERNEYQKLLRAFETYLREYGKKGWTP